MTYKITKIASSAFKVLLFFITLFLLNAPLKAIELDAHPNLTAVTSGLIEEGLYSQQELEAIFDQAQLKQSVLDAMQNPAEYKFTWGKYRKLFIQEDRIQRGVDFWTEHQDEFDRAEREFGVPGSIIAAIIGVESKYGQYKGAYKVLDSLATLVIGFERRSKFFAAELRQFLVLCKENGLNPNEILGSYAGAVGFPQFISSSYRNFAVDFSNDGKIDLINQPVDAIGSVANYFVENGWRTGEPITSEPVLEVNEEVMQLASRRRKVQHRAQTLRSLGVPLDPTIDDDELLGVLKLNASEIVPQDLDDSVYIVRAGDTACEIAESKSVSCRALFELNKLNSKGAIFRGQRLRIPEQKAAIQPTPALKDSSSSDTAAENKDKGSWTVSAKQKAAIGAVGTEKNEAEDSEIPHYFFTHENFYVITRYNQSVLYAMAVNDLSLAIAAMKNAPAANSDADGSDDLEGAD